MKKKFSVYYFMSFATLMVWLLWSRLIGINYDNGLHLHPDERWLIMLVGKINFFDKLDPNFFAYGSLPIYTLKGIVQGLDALIGTHLDNYDQALFVGRFLVSGFDIIVAGLIFLISKRLIKSTQTAWFSVVAYSFFFFVIQSSNFFIVDNFLSLFLTISLVLGLKLSEKYSYKTLTLLASAFGLALSSKITALVVLPALFLMLVASVHNLHQKFTKLRFFIDLISSGLWFVLVTLCTVALTMPFAFISHHQFLTEIKAQLAMNSDPYVFPYTLQYVGTTPYWYYLKNIFLWGIGPLAGVLAIIGIIKLKIESFRYFKTNLIDGVKQPITLFLIFYGTYFLIIGKSAVKFMRYMQPLYPMLAIAVGTALYTIFKSKFLNKTIRYFLTWGLLIAMAVWSYGFVSIYTRPHPRIVASEWINSKIKKGSVLAVEHWDDRLPLYSNNFYQYQELPIYELPDNQKKWDGINDQLKMADYLILASNRLWVPLPKLANCQTHKKCYPLTAEYYQKLLSDELQFKKVKTFTNYPTIITPFGKIVINDDFADESFTVYDHPKVVIFRKIKETI